MVKMKLFLVDKRVQPGWYLFTHKFGKFIVLDPDPASPTRLVIPVKHLITSEVRGFSISEIDQMSREDPIPPIFAPTIDILDHELSLYSPPQPIAPPSTIRSSLIELADLYIERNIAVESAINEFERKCQLSGIKFNLTQAIIAACQEVNRSGRYQKPITRTSYYRIKALLLKCNYERALVASNLGRSTKGIHKLTPATLLFVDSVILEHSGLRSNSGFDSTLYELLGDYYRRTGGKWIDPNKCIGATPVDLTIELLNAKIPIENILHNPEKSCLLVDIRLPSKNWFLGYLKWYRTNPSQSEKEMISRYGQEFYEQQICIFDTYVKKASLQLQYVFADHCLLDIFIIDEGGKEHAFRIWLTLLIDAMTRYIVGMALLAENPCIESIQSALKHAIYSKDEFLKELELDFPEGKGWDFYGIPQSLSLDNAWAHHSISLETLCRNISLNGRFNSVKLVFRPPYRGRYGGLIERYFSNIQAHIKKYLPGSIKSKEPGAVRNAAKEACLYFTDLNREIVKLIVRYLHTPHSELGGMTPHEKWLECLENTWHPPYPRTQAIERMFWRSDPNTRKINSRGISIFGMDYWSSDLANAQKVNRNGKKVEYGFRYEPSDISRLAIFRDGEYVCDVFAKQLRLPDNTYKQVSLAERKLAQKIAKSHERDSRDWLTYISEVQALSKIRVEEKKSVKRNKKRSEKLAGPISQIPSSRSDDEDTRLLAGFGS